MKTRMSKDIPEDEWGNTLPLEKWFEEAQKARETAIKKSVDQFKSKPTNQIKTAVIDFGSCCPANLDHAEHFRLAKGLQIHDIGVNDGCVCVSLLGGELNIDFVDKTLTIEPHQNGKVIDYHTPVPQKLVDAFIYKPTEGSGITSCIFVIQGENTTFEYLLTPRLDSITFSFHMEFNHS